MSNNRTRKDFNVTSLSRMYETLYKEFSANGNKDLAFYAINNALILSYFSRFIAHNHTINAAALEQEIVSQYGKNIFFIPPEYSNKYFDCYAKANNIFFDRFQDVDTSDDFLEIILGNVLEKHINQSETGAYYTPADTTAYMAWNAIIIAAINKCPSVLKRTALQLLEVDCAVNLVNNGITSKEIIQKMSQALSPDDKKSLIDIVYSLKIIDPTCGSGAFIIAAFECLEFFLAALSEKIDYDKLLSTLYGLDIEGDAIRLTKLRLIIKTANKCKNLHFFDNNFSNHFIVSDALIGSDYVISEEGFDWKNFKTKFDCIIGNPPYVEQRRYVSKAFVTQSCGNLYAHTIERACNIATNDAIISFVVPLSFVATSRMQPAKNYLEENCSSVYYATFADRPGCIFSGVHQRLTIFFAQLGADSCSVFSSKYHFWYNEERKNLFDHITFFPNSVSGTLPKIGNATEENILNKLTNGDTALTSLLVDRSDFPIYMSTRIGFWAKAFYQNIFSSKEYKVLYADNPHIQSLVTGILNSSTFYFLWVLTSDCWHVTSANLETLKISKQQLQKLDFNRIVSLVDMLMDDLEQNKKYIGSKQTDYEYKHKYSKHLIDQIDDCIAPLFSLSPFEINYIKQYTERYRVNTVEEQKSLNVLDLFSGVGGFSAGFRKAGYNIVLANEIDPDIAKSYQKNHPETIMLNEDIKDILPKVQAFKGKIDVIIGGPPCQGFSMAGARIRTNKGSAFLDDPRNYLFRHYFNIVQTLEPTFFVMENVPGMLSMSDGKIIKEIETLFTDPDNFQNGAYHIYKQVLTASDYGVPQDRNRLIIFGTKKDIDIPKLFADVKQEMESSGQIKHHTIYDAISDLNWLESGEGALEQEYQVAPLTEYQKERRGNCNVLHNHIATKHNDVAVRRIKELQPGGRRLDLTEGQDIKSVHSGAYGRMRWDELSKTIITRFDTPSSGVYIHPERHRTLTPREAARIQSFDDSFVFYGNKSSVIKQIGNAVPPLLAYYLAKVIEKARAL